MNGPLELRGPARSANSRTDGPRSIVSDATKAAARIAIVSLTARLLTRKAMCERRRWNQFTG